MANTVRSPTVEMALQAAGHIPHLHGVPGGGLVAHRPDLVGARPNKLDAVIVADVHKRCVLRQETVALRKSHHMTRLHITWLQFLWQMSKGGVHTGWIASAPRLMAAAMMLGMFRYDSELAGSPMHTASSASCAR